MALSADTQAASIADSMMQKRLPTVAGVGLLLLLANTAYISASAAPTMMYVANVFAHVIGGVILALVFSLLLATHSELRRGLAIAALLFGSATGCGIYLLVRGNTLDHRAVLVAHIALASFGTATVLMFVWRRAAMSGGWMRLRAGLVVACAGLVVIPAAAALQDRVYPKDSDRIRNPGLVPTSMREEGGGPASPFFPSSARTSVGGVIPANFFMDSATCGECHRDIYEQWQGSVHHFASFNNQFYRKSIEYMQSVVGTQPTKWCAGCHDHAVFFNGRFDRPIKEQIDTPEAHAGLACTSCHSIVHVEGSMGNGGFTIEYPALHELATSRQPLIRAISKAFTYLDPAPHRRSFMKPFMREDAAEFCSACHKVHLDVPVNNYRWFRGFNDYDNWQASGVSGQGARSFYYPAKTSTCTDCHMPLVASLDPGNHGGKVHSHRFPGANIAVPFVNRDREQLAATEAFLKSGFVSVDVFAASPVDEGEAAVPMVRRAASGATAMTGFAVGEEAEQSGDVVLRDVGRVAAPISRVGPAVKPGSTVRIDVVVRTRKIGHFFPGGTVDAFDVWLELQAHDATGRMVFWSGQVEDDGRGAVERGAHFYRSYLLDGAGNPIDKRNAWQARSLLYARLIPPGAADVAHYRLKVPRDAAGPITLTAKLHYRKFSHYYTQFAYAGEPRAGQSPGLLDASHNSLEYSFDRANIPANVSGAIKGDVPTLPIVTLAEGSATLRLATGTEDGPWAAAVVAGDRERWNDWGIGLLLQGDLKGAEYAFTRVTEADPIYADGWLNVGRALVQEGETAAARPYVDKALALDGTLGRGHFFRALIDKADGDYDAALASLSTVAAAFPRDRVVLNQIARLLFLKRQYADAIRAADRVREIDPEDLQMHYTLMLSYRAIGDHEGARREQQLFQRFKAEEASQAITARRRLVSPEENNERQTIHDHESVSLAAGGIRP
jgi:tetratricopeptide (TPR) repeat protein